MTHLQCLPFLLFFLHLFLSVFAQLASFYLLVELDPQLGVEPARILSLKYRSHYRAENNSYKLSKLNYLVLHHLPAQHGLLIIVNTSNFKVVAKKSKIWRDPSTSLPRCVVIQRCEHSSCTTLHSPTSPALTCNPQTTNNDFGQVPETDHDSYNQFRSLKIRKLHSVHYLI